MKNMLSKEAFADWCEKQPEGATYDYTKSRNCAFCQYLKALGYERPSVNFNWWRPDYYRTDYQQIPDGIGDAVLEAPWTFGALVHRLRAS